MDNDQGKPISNLLALDTVGGGVALEKFTRELRFVLENIADVNTEAKAKRTITMKFEFEPDEDREQLRVVVSTETKLASARSFGAIAYLGRKDGDPCAININPRQIPMPLGDAPPDNTNITPLVPKNPNRQ